MRILMVGGGTGGHLFPAVAIAEAFRKKDPENAVEFVVTRRPLDARVLGGKGYPFRPLTVEGIKGKGFVGKLRSLSLLPRAFKESLKIMEEILPDVVLGVGGYVTGPVILAAWWKGVPCAVQEQNSIPGMTNRWLGKMTGRVFLAFEDQGHFFSKKKARIFGNPVRQELLTAYKGQASVSGPLTLLILGGSQGAHRINRMVIEALDEVGPLKNEVNFIHQTGEEDEKVVSRAYEERGFRHQVMAFINDMAWAYGQAGMILGRAGAMTVSEITALGKPSLLIPFPFAANNHQEHNARFLVEAGAAEMVLERDIRSGFLAERVRSWLTERERLSDMGKKAAALGRKRAAEEIVEECYRLVEAKKGNKGSRGQGVKG
ncbi:MAG: undecaprenyldiphospho-muramoylpentapeptide beta-N-acetylglucosaminyltransferase [Thermodesulfobacteriota bacterium]